MTITVTFSPSRDESAPGAWWATWVPPTASMPSEVINGWGADAQACQAAFVTAYAERTGENVTAADFNFVRAITVSAYVTPSEDGVMCWADPGDRPRFIVIGETEEAARAAFVEEWNSEFGTSWEPIEFGFTAAEEMAP